MSFYPDGVGRTNLAKADSSRSAIHTPGAAGIADSPGLQGSMQQVLMENLGQYVQIDFLVGIDTLVRRTGILYSVGRSYVVLYDESAQGFILCDVFSAKFISFFGAEPPSGSALNSGLGIVVPDDAGVLRPRAGGQPGRPTGAQAELERLRAQMDRYFDQGAVPPCPAARTLGDRPT